MLTASYHTLVRSLKGRCVVARHSSRHNPLTVFDNCGSTPDAVHAPNNETVLGRFHYTMNYSVRQPPQHVFVFGLVLCQGHTLTKWAGVSKLPLLRSGTKLEEAKPKWCSRTVLRVVPVHLLSCLASCPRQKCASKPPVWTQVLGRTISTISCCTGHTWMPPPFGSPFELPSVSLAAFELASVQCRRHAWALAGTGLVVRIIQMRGFAVRDGGQW